MKLARPYDEVLGLIAAGDELGRLYVQVAAIEVLAGDAPSLDAALGRPGGSERAGMRRVRYFHRDEFIRAAAAATGAPTPWEAANALTSANPPRESAMILDEAAKLGPLPGSPRQVFRVLQRRREG